MDDVRAIDPRQTAVSRRTLLAGGLASLVVGASACRAPASEIADPDALTTRRLIQESPFFIGARGGSRDWPELTVFGFEQAAAIPAIKAMEIWVCRTADGVLVCSTDPTTKRLTGQDYTILKETWATLSSLQVTARETRDPQQPAQPFARVEDILERFIDRFVLCFEPRVNEAMTNLMALLISTGKPERIVWKQPINSLQFASVKQQGFSTWGYVLDEPAHTGDNLKRLAQSEMVDMLGVSITRGKKFVEKVVEAADQNAKPTIAINVDERALLPQALKLGCTGISSKPIREIVSAKR